MAPKELVGKTVTEMQTEMAIEALKKGGQSKKVESEAVRPPNKVTQEEAMTKAIGITY